MGRIGLINSGGESQGRQRPGRGRAHRGDQQAGRRHGPDQRPQGVPAPDQPRASSCSTPSRTSTSTARSPSPERRRRGRRPDGRAPGRTRDVRDSGRRGAATSTSRRHTLTGHCTTASDKGVLVSDTADAPSTPHELDRVIIRFAGDSGDGMQLTGDRFTSASAAVRQRPGDAAGVPGRDPRPGRHPGRRLRLPGPHLRPRHHHAGRRAQRAGGDEPGGAAGRARRARAGRHAHRQHRHLRRAQPGQGRLRDEPARPTAASTATRVYEVPMTALTKEACAPLGREAPRRRAVEELLRPRPRLVDVHPARSSRRSSGSRSSSASNPLVRDANLAAFQAGHAFGETAELFDHPLRGQAGAARARASTPTSPATPRWPGASSPPASWPSCRSSSGRYPITPASDILHELSKHKNFGVRTLQAEDEIAGIGAALGAAFGGHLGVTTTSGPGMALKAETIGLAVSLELPLLIIDIQRGGPSTGLPTKTEAADLLHGHVRPPRRVAAADRRRLQPVALLRRRHRGGPHRPEVPHAGDPAVRRLPGQRLRAVAAARRRHAARHHASPFATEPNHDQRRRRARVLAVPARSRDAGPPVGACPARPASCTASAASRRRTASGNITYDAGQPRADGRTCGPPRSPASPTTSRRSTVAGDVDDAELLVLGWGSTWGAIDAAVDRVPAPGPEGGPGPPHAPQPVPRQPRRRAAAVPARCSCPR